MTADIQFARLVRLAQFIDSHDSCRCINYTADTLTVESIGVKDGQPVTLTETIPANLGAVRDWLGY